MQLGFCDAFRSAFRDVSSALHLRIVCCMACKSLVSSSIILCSLGVLSSEQVSTHTASLVRSLVLFAEKERTLSY